MQALPNVTTPQYLICSDLDATYLAHGETAEQQRERVMLEALLSNLAHDRSALFCIVTGSSRRNVESKIRKYHLQTMPHFLAAGLGSDLLVFNQQDQQFELYAPWFEQLQMKAINQQDIDNIITTLRRDHNAQMSLQQESQQGERCRSYWLHADHDDIDQVLVDLRQLAHQAGLYVNASHGSVHASEEAGIMNIDFVPEECGKQSAVTYLVNHFDIPLEHTFAFGDSGNDLNMLRYVQHGLLVSNATDEAKQHFPHISPYPFAKAITQALQSFFAKA